MFINGGFRLPWSYYYHAVPSCAIHVFIFIAMRVRCCLLLLLFVVVGVGVSWEFCFVLEEGGIPNSVPPKIPRSSRLMKNPS